MTAWSEMTAEDWLTFFRLAGPPIKMQSNVTSAWYDAMPEARKHYALGRASELWSRHHNPSLEYYLWSWACGLEYAWRNNTAHAA